MKYNLSFTTGALLLRETSEYINHIKEYTDYLENKTAPDHLVLPTNSETSKKKFKSEIDKRLRNLNEDYLSFYETASKQDKKVILFLAICKTHKIITEFCLEIVHKKWGKFEKEVSTYDFQYFLSVKLTDKQYNSLSENTRYKLSQIAIKILKDVGILNSDGIQQIEPSPRLKNIIIHSEDEWFFDCLLIQN